MTKWSLPGRYLRIAEIIPGVYEEWTEDVLAAVDIQARGNFACLAMPYGTCTLRMDNLDRLIRQEQEKFLLLKSRWQQRSEQELTFQNHVEI